jgi:hypothetical protein
MMMITGEEKEDLRKIVEKVLQRSGDYNLQVEVMTDIIAELAGNIGLKKVEDIITGSANDWDVPMEDENLIGEELEER